MEFAFIAFWVLCSFLVWGLALGTFTKEYPYMNNTDVLWPAVFGPLALASFALFLLFHRKPGFLLKPYSKERRWGIFHKTYSSLDREYFNERHG
jgi:hypothetical protein